MFVRGRPQDAPRFTIRCLELFEGGVAGVAGGEVVGDGRPDGPVARTARVVTREGGAPDFVAPMLVFREGVAENPRRCDEDYVAGSRSSAMCI